MLGPVICVALNYSLGRIRLILKSAFQVVANHSGAASLFPYASAPNMLHPIYVSKRSGACHRICLT